MYTKLSIRPRLNISPQLVFASKMLQTPGHALEQLINKELAINPALELANKPDFGDAKRPVAKESDKPTSYSGRSNRHSFDEFVENIAQTLSPIEKLAEQLPVTLDKSDREIATFLLHCLDHRGYLVNPKEELAEELGVPIETVIRVTQVLHQLEPPGIGAQDIRECFSIQCAYLEVEGIDCRLVRSILALAWDEFLNQQWDRVAKKIKETPRAVKEACEFMRLNLCPYPLAMLGPSVDTSETLIYADLIVVRNDDISAPAYSLEVPGEEEFELNVSASFEKMIASQTREEYGLSTQERAWVKFHLNQASLIIATLRQRWETLRRIGEFLLQYQKDFLDDGPLYLKPLTRAVVAQKLNVHESTVSRAVSNKAIQLPNGRIIPLSDFFDSSMPAKEAIRLFLRDTSKRLCDREITEGLQAMGMKLSRRTVTKYRLEMNMNSSRRQINGI